MNFFRLATNQTLPALIGELFPPAVAPKKFPCNDFLTVLFKGIGGLNQPVTLVCAAELMRLNAEIPIAVGAQNPLGVAERDNSQQCVGPNEDFCVFNLFGLGKNKAPIVSAKCLISLPILVGANGLEPSTPTMSRWETAFSGTLWNRVFIGEMVFSCSAKPLKIYPGFWYFFGTFISEVIMATRIDTVASREKLKPRRGPYWHRLSKGCYVGLRKMTVGSAGVWRARARDEETTVQQRHLSLGSFSNSPITFASTPLRGLPLPGLSISDVGARPKCLPCPTPAHGT